MDKSMRFFPISHALPAFVLLALSALAAAPLSAHTHEPKPAPAEAATAAATPRVAVELTFILAKPGERKRAVEYIERNWFAMDAIAKTQGLMDDYRVMDTGSDEGPWNVLVEVTYRDARGYEGVREAFEKIRAAHREVLIDGKRLRDLGQIVESKKTFSSRRADAHVDVDNATSK
jgi:hypothetical protein